MVFPINNIQPSLSQRKDTKCVYENIHEHLAAIGLLSYHIGYITILKVVD